MPKHRRFFQLLAAVASVTAVTIPARAQVVGPNIDVIQYKPGDPIPHDPGHPANSNPLTGVDILNRMLETDIAADPRGPARAVAVFNDYRYSLSSGQSWCSWAYTKNGGNTWQNFAIPDLPGTPHYVAGNFCSDPVVVFDVFGTAHVVVLAGTRGVDTQVFELKIRTKNDGSGDLLPPTSADIVMLDNGNNVVGANLDKPSVTYNPPTAANPVCSASKPGALGCGSIQAFWAIFDGTAGRTKIMHAHSYDGGASYSRPVKLNNTLRNTNMTAAAVSPTVDRTIYVAFTNFDSENRGIFIVRSTDDGNSWSNPLTVAGGAAPFFPYNQDLSSGSGLPMDRSLIIPTLIVAAGGQLLAGFQEYVNSSGQPASPLNSSGTLDLSVKPHVVFTASFDKGTTWSLRRAGEIGPPEAIQLKPRLAYSGGVASAIFEDSRNVWQNGASDFGGAVQTGGGCVYSQASGAGLPYLNGVDCKRNVRVMQTPDLTNWISGLPSWGASKRVTQFPVRSGVVISRGTNCDGEIVTAGVSNGTCRAVYEPNVTSSASGTAAFSGDYTGHAADHPLVPENGVWRFPTKSTDPRTFYALWDDNRWQRYPTQPAQTSPRQNKNNIWVNYNGLDVNPGTRDYKPFFAKVSPGLVMFWTGTDAKQSDGTVEFVVTLQNLTGNDLFVQETLSDSANWSFSSGSSLSSFNTKLGRFSSVTKKVVRNSSSLFTSVQVSAVQIADIYGTAVPNPLTASVGFNLSSLTCQSCNHVLNINPPTFRTVGNLNPKTQPSTRNDAFDSDAFDSDAFDSDAFDSDAFDSDAFDSTAPPDQDTTWTITGAGLSTAVNTLAVVDNGDLLLDNSLGFQLLFYQTYVIPYPDTIHWENLKKFPIDVPLSNVRISGNNHTRQINDAFDSDAFDSDAFDSTAPSDLISNASGFVGSGNTLKVTLRDYKPKPSVNPNPPPFNPATSASQAAVTQTATGSLATSFSDPSPPVITAFCNGVTPCSTGWYKTNVTVHWTVFDKGSGPYPPVQAPNCPDVQLLTETPATGTTLTCTAVNGAGSSGAGSVTIKIDKTPPTITLTTPVQGATYFVNQTVLANYGCTDALSGVATCTGPVASGAAIDTATAGVKTFTVNAMDNAGNAATQPVSYTVVGYTFIGFFSPLGAPGAFWPGSFNLGRGVPIKYQLKLGATIITDTRTLKSLTATFTGSPNQQGVCPVSTTGTRTLTLHSPTAGTTGGSTFRFDPSNQQFIFTWDTSKGDLANPAPPVAGCYTLKADFDDNMTTKSGSLLLTQ